MRLGGECMPRGFLLRRRSEHSGSEAFDGVDVGLRRLVAGLPACGLLELIKNRSQLFFLVFSGGAKEYFELLLFLTT